MKAEELMIGDWVSVSGTPMRVACVGSMKCGFQDTKGEYFYHGYDVIEPIPLTTKLLEKCGFEWDGDSTLHRKIDGVNWGLIWWAKDTFYVGMYRGNARIGVDARHVHQFQHALRLFGVDPGITL